MVVRHPVLALLTATVVAGCSGSGATSDSISPGDAPSVTTDMNPETSTEPTTPPPPTDASTTSETTSTEATTTSSPPSTTIAPESAPDSATDEGGDPDDPSELFTFDVPAPTGELVTDPGALVVLETDGDLLFLPDALTPGNDTPPIELLDLPDPRDASTEGPGPNFVEDVAGIVDGSVVYGDCCEPVSGNLYAVPVVGQNELFGVGSNPNLSPDGERLATANSNAITIVDLATGAGTGVQLNQSPDAPFQDIADLEWVDDNTLATLGIVDQEFELTLWDATTLTKIAFGRVEQLADLDQARFAGRTPDGRLAVEVTGPDLTTVRIIDGLDEDVEARLQFPPTVSGIEIDSGGGGITWIDGGTLYSLSAGTFVARPLRDDVRSSWFVGAP